MRTLTPAPPTRPPARQQGKEEKEDQLSLLEDDDVCPVCLEPYTDGEWGSPAGRVIKWREWVCWEVGLVSLLGDDDVCPVCLEPYTQGGFAAGAV